MVTNLAVRPLVLMLATVGGVGYAPIAPGTAGSLVAIPLVPWIAGLRAASWPSAVGFVAALALVAIWAAGRAERLLGRHDHARIVIDEVAGLSVAALFVPATWLAATTAFAAFRLFDVWKPYPVGAIDRSTRGGLGVVADDLVAGVYAGALTRAVLEVL